MTESESNVEELCPSEPESYDQPEHSSPPFVSDFCQYVCAVFLANGEKMRALIQHFQANKQVPFSNSTQIKKTVFVQASTVGRVQVVSVLSSP